MQLHMARLLPFPLEVQVQVFRQTFPRLFSKLLSFSCTIEEYTISVCNSLAPEWSFSSSLFALSPIGTGVGGYDNVSNVPKTIDTIVALFVSLAIALVVKTLANWIACFERGGGRAIRGDLGTLWTAQAKRPIREGF